MNNVKQFIHENRQSNKVIMHIYEYLVCNKEYRGKYLYFFIK